MFLSNMLHLTPKNQMRSYRVSNSLKGYLDNLLSPQTSQESSKAKVVQLLKQSHIFASKTIVKISFFGYQSNKSHLIKRTNNEKTLDFTCSNVKFPLLKH